MRAPSMALDKPEEWVEQNYVRPQRLRLWVPASAYP